MGLVQRTCRNFYSTTISYLSERIVAAFRAYLVRFKNFLIDEIQPLVLWRHNIGFRRKRSPVRLENMPSITSQFPRIRSLLLCG